jgi:hypothetical protein
MLRPEPRIRMNLRRKVTNVDAKRGKKKQIWYEDTAREVRESEWGPRFADVPSRYGPSREVVATCYDTETADHIVALWNGGLGAAPEIVVSR